MNLIRAYTDIAVMIIPTVCGLYPLLQKDQKKTRWFIVCLIINQLIVEIVKSLTGIDRPNGGVRAFPSGHTSASFLGPFFLMQWCGLSLTNPLVFFTMVGAAFIGLGRIIIHQHWPLDVLGGIANGCFVPWFTYQIEAASANKLYQKPK